MFFSASPPISTLGSILSRTFPQFDLSCDTWSGVASPLNGSDVNDGVHHRHTVTQREVIGDHIDDLPPRDEFPDPERCDSFSLELFPTHPR
jgi:hypothetical protein